MKPFYQLEQKGQKQSEFLFIWKCVDKGLFCLTKSFLSQNWWEADEIAFIEQIALYNIYLKQFGVCLLCILNPKVNIYIWRHN